MTQLKPKQLLVKGEQVANTKASINGAQLKASYQIGTATRGAQETHAVDLDDPNHLLEFVFDDNSNWICDAGTLHELFPNVNIPDRAGEGFVVPNAIANVDAERGLVGQAALKLLNVFTKQTVSDGVKGIAGKLENKSIGSTEGLCIFNKDFTLGKFQADDKPADSPVLLFIHGTNSNSVGAFEKFKGSQVWDFMHNTYKTVLAFEHRTLTKSPLENALDLVQQLPKDATLHIISHSRGGIVGDILCRYSKDDGKSFLGFLDAHMRLLKTEGRDDDIDCIKELDTAFGKKNIKVTKFIRVASPAAGTRLASTRLDNIFNALFNLLGGNANPVADIFKELIAETVKTKSNVNVLPGIEAMCPDSPFIKIMNDRSEDAGIGGSSLAVISGNGKLSLSVKSFGIILGKLFFGQRNDLVVNTDSMYLGTRRNGNIQYFFDQNGDVNHFNYFLNSNTRTAINEALKADDGAAIPGFTAVSQYEVPASDRGLLNLEHGELSPFPNVPSGDKPIVVLLPGIMGSNLSKGKDKLWLNYAASFLGGLFRMERLDDTAITATSIISTSYKQLATRLSHNYDVVIYPFDWRKQLNECANDFNDKIVELLKFNQPIKIIGHSMGGVLVRDFIINHDDTWKRLNASQGFKLLYLGSPLGGSYRILTVLFGNDAIINSLNMLDIKHTKKELLTMFSTFPGILSLLPLTTDKDKEGDLGKIETWQKMADTLGDSKWPLPPKDQLKTFADYRDNILAKSDGIDYTNIIYIAGKDKATPCGFYNDDIPPRTELVFLSTGEGDQSVTWELGIPKKLDKKQVYYVNVSHGALANEPKIFDAIEQIIANGSTTALTNERPLIRGGEQQFRTPVVYNFDLSERGVSNAVLGITGENVQQSNQVPLAVSVSCGCLDYSSWHVLAGHFINDGILYAESAINNALNNNLAKRHSLGIYPGEIGTNTIVTGNEDKDRISGTIIVGLGEPGKLSPYLLATTVEKGILKYLLNINSKKPSRKEIGISALMIGCGYGGLSIENSIKAIIEGVNSANTKMLKVQKDDDAVRLVQNIEFVELYEDKALSCLYSLTKIETYENSTYNIRIADRKIREMFGAQKNLISTAISEAWWNRVSVRFNKPKEITDSKGKSIIKEEPSIVFNASTGDAREEENELFSSTPLIDLFIEQMSTQNEWSATYAKTLFELMIPNEFKQNLKKKGNILWVLDKDAASYPWELLQDSMNDAKPLCINAGMIRQLTTSNYRADIRRASTDLALIVADPVLSGFLPQLKGAEKEGSNVEKLLEINNYNRISLIGKTATDIIPCIYSNEFKIMHLAGHGLFNPTSINDSGMVIGKNLFLSVNSIKQMSTVPELVFVNCCHLGKVNPDYELYFANRYRLAANIGTELIEMGVKAVIAAGWAVDDAAALEFAIKFYAEMLSGETFGDAVKKARNLIYEKFSAGNNTWGAYQCYGDPYYKLRNRTPKSSRKEEAPVFIIRDEAEVQLNNLRKNLDTRLSTPDKSKTKLQLISTAVDKAKIGGGTTLEQEALIYYELGEYETAIVKFELLRKAENADFSVSALEQYCVARAKKLVIDFKLSHGKLSVIEEMDDVIKDFDHLSIINRTFERQILIAETYKRKALVSTNKKDKMLAYNTAIEYYEKAINGNKDKRSIGSKVLCDLTVLRMLLLDKTAQKPADKKENNQHLSTIKARVAVLNNYTRKLDYWESMEYLWAFLSWIVLGGKVKIEDEDQMWKRILKWYKKNWKDAASKGKQLGEIENLEMLADIVANSSLTKKAALQERLDDLREGLEKFLLS